MPDRQTASAYRCSPETPGTCRSAARFTPMNQNGILAVGLLTHRDLTVLGPTFTRLWPVDQAPAFNELLRAIDEADAELRRAESAKQAEPGRAH